MMFTGTHRVERDDAGTAKKKSSSKGSRAAATVSTASTTSCSLISDEFNGEDSDVFMRMLVQEMIHVAREAVQDETINPDKSLDLEEMAKLMVQGIKRNGPKSAKDALSTTSNSVKSGGDYTKSTVSGQSNDSTRDPFNPDSWSVDQADETCTRARTELYSAERPRRQSSVKFDLSGPAIEEFLARLDDTSSSHDDGDDDDDECSVLSEMTGLTGVFSDFPLDHRERAPARETPAKQSRPKSSACTMVEGRRSLVSFSSVDVRHYERILTNNPACSKGPPIGIGWNFYETGESVSVDDWQLARRRLRGQSELVLSREKRETILLEWGVSRPQMAAAVRHLNKAKNQRRQTINNIAAQPVEEMVESAKQRVRNIFANSNNRSSKR